MKRIKQAAKDAGVEFETFPRKGHQGIRVGSIKTTIGRHSETSNSHGRNDLQATRSRTWRGLVAMNFTSTARKDGRWWVVQCDQHPGALSQVARLDQAAEHQREAIAFVADLNESEVEVDVRVVIDAGVEDVLAKAREDRRRSGELAAAASEGFRKAAGVLSHDGYSLRDVGAIVGVSHQRAAQLIKQG